MRNLFIALLFSFYSYGQQYTVVQINARWNISNDVKLNLPSNVKYKYAYLEEQKESMRKNLKAVPVIVLYKNERPIKQWNADITFKLNIKEEEILNYVQN